jgi:hypothetical protein
MAATPPAQAGGGDHAQSFLVQLDAPARAQMVDGNTICACKQDDPRASDRVIRE